LLLNALILLLLTVGNTELAVAVLNRVHGFCITHHVLRRFRHLHDALLVAGPIGLVCFAGFGESGVFNGGTWRHLPPAVFAWVMLCLAGLAGFCWSVIRWNLQLRPKTLTNDDAHVYDLSGNPGPPPIGDGPHSFLARIPGNEVFHLESGTKTYQLSSIPSEWHDGLRILHFSDLHFVGTPTRDWFDRIIDAAADFEVDLIAFTGDLIDREHLISWIPETLGRLTAPLGCYFCLGNHDWYRSDTERIRACLSDCGWTSVAGRTVVVEHKGRKLALSGTELPWMGQHPDMAGVGTDTFSLLLSHTPDNLGWARKHGINVMLAGHTHGGQVALPVIGPVFAPSRYGVSRAAGDFMVGNMLLHVSRGIAGDKPLRWNCRPELTKLVLKRLKTEETCLTFSLQPSAS